MREQHFYRIIIVLFLSCVLCCALLLGNHAAKLQKETSITPSPSPFFQAETNKNASPTSLPPTITLCQPSATPVPPTATSKTPSATPLPYQKEELAEAVLCLQSAGILPEEIIMENPISRSSFIRLIVSSLGAELPSTISDIPGETWYAPYVKAGYSIGLFSGSTQNMSFTPTCGFNMGERGYAEMELPISRTDAAVIIANTLQLEDNQSSTDISLENVSKYLPLSTKDSAYATESLTCGEAIICAWKFLENELPIPSTSEATSLSLEEALRSGRIIHAGGKITAPNKKSYTYTNSAEALVNAYRAGNRVMEFDFMQTSDGHLAAIHDWTADTAPTITDGEPLSLEEWLKAEIYKHFTPLCLESLADFMREHSDLYIVTDVKDNNVDAAALIASTCPDLVDRFVIQIYKDREYQKVRELGFKNIIYTLYNLSKAQKQDTAHWVAFAAENPLVGYTYPDSWREVPGYTEEMKKTGVMLFVHTINDLSVIDTCYSEGFTAVYTDIVD